MTINKAGTKESLVVVILDGSGSMSAITGKTIEGFNSFLVDQQASEIPTRLSLYTFHGHDTKTIYEYSPIESVESLNIYNYTTTGSTNLLDSIGYAIEQTNDYLGRMSEEERPSVIVCIITDGEENASSKYKNQDIKNLVKQAEENDWVFMFLGANVDAFAVGNAFGMKNTNTMQYGTNNMLATMNAMSSLTQKFKTARTMNLSTQAVYDANSFTDKERSSAL